MKYRSLALIAFGILISRAYAIEDTVERCISIGLENNTSEQELFKMPLDADGNFVFVDPKGKTHLLKKRIQTSLTIS